MGDLISAGISVVLVAGATLHTIPSSDTAPWATLLGLVESWGSSSTSSSSVTSNLWYLFDLVVCKWKAFKCKVFKRKAYKWKAFKPLNSHDKQSVTTK